MAIYIDDVVMNGKAEICHALGIDKNTIPVHRRKLFEFTHKKPDADGRVRSKKSIGGKPEYSVMVPKLGREVKVRYGISQRKDKDQNFVYAPTMLSLEPAEDGSVLMSDELAFIFWFLRPMCRQSPFRQRTDKFFYEYQDNEAKATATVEKEQKRIDALNIIVGVNEGWSMSKLRQLAKGMKMSGVDDMTDNVVKDKLIAKAYSDPLEFVNQASSREIIFSGKIQEAIDRNILNIKKPNGMARWYLNEEEILPLQYGVDERAELMNYMALNWHLHADKLQAALDNKTIETNLNNPENDKFFDEPVPEVNMPAQIGASMTDLMKQLNEDEKLREKIIRFSKLDPEDPSVHHMIRRQIKDAMPLIEAYRKSLEAIVPETV